MVEEFTSEEKELGADPKPWRQPHTDPKPWTERTRNGENMYIYICMYTSIYGYTDENKDALLRGLCLKHSIASYCSMQATIDNSKFIGWQINY